jgi:serine phosphatase RsbU (regulator of sigma subunit)/anti-sigma regulatory factor (Ser/Thr protein kinase)/transposase
MALRKPTEIFMSFAADEKMLEDIRRSIGEAIADVNLSDKERNSVLLAIEEGCTNVIRHAYLYGPGTIRIKIKKQPNQVTFSIFDKGRRFDFNRANTPDLDRYVKTGRKGGLGLYLIRRMMNSVDYFSKDGENELRMTKSIVPKSQIMLKPPGMSIRLKFALWASFVVFLIVSTIFFYYDRRNRTSIRERFFSEALNFSQTAALNIADKISVGNELELANIVNSAIKGNSNLKYMTVIDTSGLIWADALNPNNILSRYSYPDGVDTTQAGQFQTIVLNGETEIYNLITEIPGTDRVLGKVNLGFSKEGLAQQLNRARRNMSIFALLGLLIGLVAVYLLSYYFVKPIQKLTEGVLKIGQGNLEETLPVDGSDEFSEIARAFNEITLKFKSAQVNMVEQERLQKEMQVAQEIQHALLPARFPQIEGYELAAVYRAAKDVGGDYFDFVWIDEDTLGIIVADVSGKGVPGSLVMTMIRTAIRLESRGNQSPSDILARVNDFVAEDVKKGMFITIFFILLDSKQRQISFASAGHNPMILYRQDSQKCYFLNPKGIPLGLTLPDDISFRDSLEIDKLKLKKDDLLVIYTDGITEAMNNRSELYGNDRLIEFIKTHSQLSPDEFAAALDQDLASFTGNAPQNDDITLVVIKEKIMVDELIFEKRKRLLQMVEEENIPIEEACQQMGVSVGTFYKYRRRWKQQGDAGLLNKKLRAQEDIRQLSYTARKKILELVRENPEIGASKIQKMLAEAGENYSIRRVYDELVNMRLNSKAKRLAFVERVGGLKPEQKEMLEKELLREERKELNRGQYAEGLKKTMESRQAEKMVQETGRIVSQLKQLGPAVGKANLYGEIAQELEKLEGGSDIAKLFQSLVTKMEKDIPAEPTKESSKPQPIPQPVPESAPEPSEVKIAEPSLTPKEQPAEQTKLGTQSKPVIVAPSSGEKIDIEQKAVKKESSSSPLDNFDEYEKKLTEKFKK